MHILHCENGSFEVLSLHLLDGGIISVTSSPGDPTPQRQCAWLLSTCLKEGEEQKEVLEAKDDEKKESEVDGEVEERVSQRVHET